MKTTTVGITVVFSALLLCSTAAAGTDKTLASWVALANTAQRGGSALTIQRGGQFDAIVFGETAAGKWMAGSDYYSRTQRDQSGSAAEKSDDKTLIQIAIVYKGSQVSIFRNGALMRRIRPKTLICWASLTTSSSSVGGIGVLLPARRFAAPLRTPGFTSER